ncbi:hypothetical protein B9Z42_10000 [Limnohabitans sp. B9-3]|nr:hypothetical protein B9Z42_10000 [Limnohabitans sp. B9-3]
MRRARLCHLLSHAFALWPMGASLDAIIAGCNSTKNKQTGLGPTQSLMRPWLKALSFDAAPQGFAKKHPGFFVDEIH